MFEAFVITLREGIEAALVTGIMVTYLQKTGRAALARWIYLGLAAGVAGSLVAAAIISRLGIDEEAYEGWLMLLGSIFVASMVAWMLATARSLKHGIESRLQEIVAKPSGAIGAGLFGLTFLLVLREGIEVVLFLAAVNLTTSALLAFSGGIAGLLLAALFGVAFVRGTVRIDIGRFFKVTGIVLFVFAAQLLIGGLHEFGERGTIPIGRSEMRLIGPIVKNQALLLVSLLALPMIVLLVPGRKERARAKDAERLEGPERRLAVARLARERRWKTAFAIAGIVVVGSLAASYAYSRLPRAIDPPKLLEAQESGEVRIPVDGLNDGHLHRFGVPIDGTVVRFFIMTSGSRLIPSFDACQVCGAYGYVETQGRLTCLACAADINTASLGTGGGCNPLPLAFREEGGAIVIAVKDLAERAPEFRDAAASEPATPGAGS